MKNFGELMIVRGIILLAFFNWGLSAGVYAQTNGLQLVPRDQLPRGGTFYFAKGPTGHPTAPLPCPPHDLDAPIYALTNGHFLIDDTDVDYTARTQARAMATRSSLVPARA